MRVPAKVNLALQVAPRRPDGYHDLRTVFCSVSLYDTLVCRPIIGDALRLTVLGRQAALIPHDGTDLTVRAARLLRDRFGQATTGVHMTLTKSIPVAGGMAGGSADAAAALIGCNALWHLGVGDEGLHALARELGADVPFGLLGGVALGEGRGDVLTPLPAPIKLIWVLAFSSQRLSTAEVFAAYDTQLSDSVPVALDGLRRALAAGDALAVAGHLSNDLEGPAVRLLPPLRETLDYGRRLDGVLGAVLSGSGPTCAFLCAEEGVTKSIASALASLPQVSGTRVVTGPALPANPCISA